MSDPALTIWRYMSFRNFLRMLEHHALWFARPYTFPDKWDGHYPPSFLKSLRAIYGDDDATLKRDFERRFKRRQYGFFVNCWHQSEHECVGMWGRYGAAPEGVAIKSTTEDAVGCLHPFGSGLVRYYDPTDDIRHETIIARFDEILYKRNEFLFEREWRMWQCDDETLQRLGDRQPEFDVSSLDGGINCSIEDMPRLIHKLVIAPAATDEFVEKIKGICIDRKRRWLAELVERSTCDLEPIAFMT